MEAAEQRLGVVGVVDGAEQSHQVLDLPALEVPATPVDHVGDPRLLEGPRRRLHVVVPPEQPGDPGRIGAAVDEPPALAGHLDDLPPLVVGAPHLDRPAGAAVRHQVLLDAGAGRGGRDDGPARLHDLLVGTVVAVEDDPFVPRVDAREAVEVGEGRSSELVDGLVVVGDHQEVAPCLGQRLDQPGLGVVGVLVLVDHHVVDGSRDRLPDVGVLAEQALRIEDGVVVVEHCPLQEDGLQPPVDLGALAMPGEQLALQAAARLGQPCLRPGRVRLRRDQLLLGLLDEVEDGVDEVVRAQRVVEGGGPQLAEDGVDHQPALRLVGDPECGRDPQPPAEAPQDALGEGVVVEQWRLALEGSVDPLHPVAHLGRRLARVGEHQQAFGGDPLADQAEEALDDDPGLARPGAGQDQARTLPVLDRPPLRLVQLGGSPAVRRGPILPGLARRLRQRIGHRAMIPHRAYIRLSAGRLRAAPC